MHYVDHLPWPVGVKYAVSKDLLYFVIFKDNIKDSLLNKTPEAILIFNQQVMKAMTHIRTVNPAVTLVIKDGHGA